MRPSSDRHTPVASGLNRVPPDLKGSSPDFVECLIQAWYQGDLLDLYRLTVDWPWLTMVSLQYLALLQICRILAAKWCDLSRKLRLTVRTAVPGTHVKECATASALPWWTMNYHELSMVGKCMKMLEDGWRCSVWVQPICLVAHTSRCPLQWAISSSELGIALHQWGARFGGKASHEFRRSHGDWRWGVSCLQRTNILWLVRLPPFHLRDQNG